MPPAVLQPPRCSGSVAASRVGHCVQLGLLQTWWIAMFKKLRLASAGKIAGLRLCFSAGLAACGQRLVQGPTLRAFIWNLSDSIPVPHQAWWASQKQADALPSRPGCSTACSLAQKAGYCLDLGTRLPACRPSARRRSLTRYRQRTRPSSRAAGEAVLGYQSRGAMYGLATLLVAPHLRWHVLQLAY